jgi:hypothetical protein
MTSPIFILKVIEKIIEKHPDLRVGQLISSCLDNEEKLFFISDDELIDRLLILYGKGDK